MVSLCSNENTWVSRLCCLFRFSGTKWCSGGGHCVLEFCKVGRFLLQGFQSVLIKRRWGLMLEKAVL
jgi:hypothetical protein